MPPNSAATDGSGQSSLGFKNDHRDRHMRNLDHWFTAKATVDGAEGLWRVHDSLYDLTSFLDNHPGGQFWLEITRGTDVTEAFETHHISTKAENLLSKFYVREAKTPRTSPYLFEEDGFYKTLKRAVREELEKVPKDAHKVTDTIMDGLFVATLLTVVLANVFWSYALAVASGFLCGMARIAAHNYTHRKDNFRMHYMDFFVGSSRNFRIAHVISHHLYTNTVLDIQAYSLFEPLLVYFPQKKTWSQKYLSILTAPLLIWPLSFPLGTLFKWYVIVFRSRNKWAQIKSDKAVFLPLILPGLMYFASSQSVVATFFMWMLVMCVGSFFFGSIGFTMGHFHPDIFLDGDTPRSKEELDWGVCQLDRYEITGSLFLVLVLFGDHAGHHLFPTLDVAVVQHIEPVIDRVVKQFNLNIRQTNQPRIYWGYLRRVAREIPNPNPPDLHKPIK